MFVYIEVVVMLTREQLMIAALSVALAGGEDGRTPASLLPDTRGWTLIITAPLTIHSLSAAGRTEAR